MQKEIDLINQEHQRQKELRGEQERVAEQKVVEYMNQKAVNKVVCVQSLCSYLTACLLACG